MNTIVEPSRKIPVRCETDVLVVGGGLSGVSAAVASARAGVDTILVERNGFPGGVATAGMCCSVFNCYYTPKHEIVVKGNSLEFVDELAKGGGGGDKWHNHKGHIIYDVERGKLTLIEFLEKAKVKYFFDAIFSNVIMEGNGISGVIIESKSGREAIKAKVVIDATGDSDVAYYAGTPLKTIDANHSYCFRIGNVDVDKFVQYFRDNPGEYPDYMDVDWVFEEAYKHYKDTGTFLFPHGGGMQLSLIKKGKEKGEFREVLGMQNTLDALQMHAMRDAGTVHIITGHVKIGNMDIEKITKAMTDGKKMAFYVTDYFRKHVPGFERAFVSATADDLGIRATRYIDGDFAFTNEMKSNPARFDDAIGRGVVERDYIKNKSRGAWGVQTFLDDSFDIPYRCLLPRKVENLLMGSGRSVSAENPFLLRAMALTMVIGQGAGVAAAIAVQDGVVARSVKMSKVRKELLKQGVELNK